MAWTHDNVEVLVAVLFSTVAIVHLVRNLSDWALQLGPYAVPQWLSWIAVLLTGYLAYHFWHRILA